MATKTGGGANHLTVQESKNIKLGQKNWTYPSDWGHIERSDFN